MEELTGSLIQFFKDIKWLLPLGISFVFQVVVTHKAKPHLPEGWSSGKRDLVITGLCILTGLSTFMAGRWASETIAGQPFELAHFVLSVLVGLAFIGLVPFIYKAFPKSFREHYSYKTKRAEKNRMKGVQTVSGAIEERPADQPSKKGETTVIKPYDRTRLKSDD